MDRPGADQEIKRSRTGNITTLLTCRDEESTRCLRLTAAGHKTDIHKNIADAIVVYKIQGHHYQMMSLIFYTNIKLCCNFLLFWQGQQISGLAEYRMTFIWFNIKEWWQELTRVTRQELLCNKNSHCGNLKRQCALKYSGREPVHVLCVCGLVFRYWCNSFRKGGILTGFSTKRTPRLSLPSLFRRMTRSLEYWCPAKSHGGNFKTSN